MFHVQFFYIFIYIYYLYFIFIFLLSMRLMQFISLNKSYTRTAQTAKILQIFIHPQLTNLSILLQAVFLVHPTSAQICSMCFPSLHRLTILIVFDCHNFLLFLIFRNLHYTFSYLSRQGRNLSPLFAKPSTKLKESKTIVFKFVCFS